MFKHQSEQLNKLSMIFFSNIPLKLIWSSILGTLTYLTGCEASILQALAILIVIDTLFGVIVAIKNKTLQSWSILTLSIFKICIYMLLLIGTYQATLLGIPEWFNDLIMFLIATTEFISILESVSLLGFKSARKIIDKINKEVEEKLFK